MQTVIEGLLHSEPSRRLTASKTLEWVADIDGRMARNDMTSAATSGGARSPRVFKVTPRLLPSPSQVEHLSPRSYSPLAGVAPESKQSSFFDRLAGNLLSPGSLHKPKESRWFKARAGSSTDATASLASSTDATPSSAALFDRYHGLLSD